jgi:hypothetical protein
MRRTNVLKKRFLNVRYVRRSTHKLHNSLTRKSRKFGWSMRIASIPNFRSESS